MRVVAETAVCERFSCLPNEAITNVFENGAQAWIKEEWKDYEPLLRRLRQSCYLGDRNEWLTPENRLKEQYQKDGLVLFLGAGVSTKSGIPNWVVLSESMLTKVGAPPPKELDPDRTTELLEELGSAGEHANELLQGIRSKGRPAADARTLEEAASLLAALRLTLATGDGVKQLLRRFDEVYERLHWHQGKFLKELYCCLYRDVDRTLRKLLREIPRPRKEQLEWRDWEKCRDALAENKSLAVVGDLLVLRDGEQWRRNPQIHAVLTVNADNLLELYCQARTEGHRLVTQVDRASVGDHPNTTPVCHLHGTLDIRCENFMRDENYVKDENCLRDENCCMRGVEFKELSMKDDLLPDVVFRTSEYDRTLADPTSFVNVTPQSYMQRLNVVFFGTSLDDPNICRWLHSSYRERVEHRTKYLRELHCDRYGAAQSEAEWESVRHFWLRHETERDRALPDKEKKRIEREKRELGVQVVWCKDHGQACLQSLKPCDRADFGRRSHRPVGCWCNE